MQSNLNSCTIKEALHLRWLTTENFQNYETKKGGCFPSENKFKIEKKTISSGGSLLI